mgnify:CR=1 FL=1
MKTISDRKPLGAALLVFMLVWVMSFFIFPVGFRGLPESLNVLLHELQGLALSITME